MASSSLEQSEIRTGLRFPRLTEEQMNPRQREIAAEFLGFSLKGMNAAFNMMLRAPEAADRFQAMGGYLRYETGLDEGLLELAILVHARIWNDQYEWKVHAPRAVACGISPEIVEAVRLGDAPAGLSGAPAAMYRFAVELVRDRGVSDAALHDAFAHFGEKGVIDLVFFLGHYGTISMLLAVANEPVEGGELPARAHPFTGENA